MNKPITYNLLNRNKNYPPLEDFNCGGYAFRTFEWFAPIEDLSSYYFYSRFLNGMSKKEIVEEFLEDCTKGVLKSLGRSIRRLSTLKEKLNKGEELVALRVGFIKENSSDDFEVDYDYHFKVKRRGIWLHKQGRHPISPCFLTKRKAWTNGHLEYGSDIVYFAHKYK